MDTSCSQKNGPKPPQPIAGEGENARRSFKIARNLRLKFARHGPEGMDIQNGLATTIITMTIMSIVGTSFM